MRASFQGVAVDMARAESSRFRHPLLFIHGLWAGSWVWRGFMGYLAHRGWDSWAPSFLEGTADLSADDRVDRLTGLCGTLPAPPVIVSHDAGAMIATRLASAIGAPAVVGIAPLLSRCDGSTAGIFAWPQFWTARLFGRALAPPRGAGRALFLDPRLDQPDALRSDAGPMFRRLAAGGLQFPDEATAPPMLLIGASGDPITSAEHVEQLAARRGWTFHRHSGETHFPTLEPGWERLADDVHRWLVRTLGERLLTFLDEEGDDE